MVSPYDDSLGKPRAMPTDMMQFTYSKSDLQLTVQFINHQTGLPVALYPIFFVSDLDAQQGLHLDSPQIEATHILYGRKIESEDDGIFKGVKLADNSSVDPSAWVMYFLGKTDHFTYTFYTGDRKDGYICMQGLGDFTNKLSIPDKQFVAPQSIRLVNLLVEPAASESSTTASSSSSETSCETTSPSETTDSSHTLPITGGAASSSSASTENPGGNGNSIVSSSTNSLTASTTNVKSSTQGRTLPKTGAQNQVLRLLFFDLVLLSLAGGMIIRHLDKQDSQQNS